MHKFLFWCGLLLFHLPFADIYYFVFLTISKIVSIILYIDKKIVPKAANDIKLINAGKILENNKTVGQCRVPFGDLPRGVITMHVVVQPSLAKAKTGNFILKYFV